MLLGTPLALVQAELDLSLLGLPLIDMSFAALRGDIATTDPLRRADRALTARALRRPAGKPDRARTTG